MLPSTGAVIAGTGASVAGIGTAAWATAGNITASDDTRTTSSVGTGVSRWLAATNFTMTTLPDDAVITRLVGTVEASYTTNVATITSLSMIVGDAPVGNTITVSQAVTTSDASYSFDLLPGSVGVDITAALLKTSTTGFAVSMTGSNAICTARVDAMYLTVEYMVAGRTFRTRRVRRVNRH